MHEKVQTQHVARETAHSGWFCISAPTGDTWRLLMKRTNGQKKKCNSKQNIMKSDFHILELHVSFAWEKL